MTGRILRYSAGNEHNPTDPWGRSELTVHGDGRAELEQAGALAVYDDVADLLDHLDGWL